ncbi:MAG: DUF748 domain-containing protein [Syntrophorhabdaceae bacterium]
MTRKNRMIILITSGIVFFIILAAILGLVRYANVIARAGVEKALGKDFSVGSIELNWAGVRARNIALKNKAGRDVVSIEQLTVRADFMSILRKKYVIASVSLENPYMYVEVDHKGNLVSPVFPSRENKPDKQKAGAEPVASPVVFKKITVKNGSVDYLDRKSPKVPVLTKVRGINLEMTDVTHPFTNDTSKYSVHATVPTGRHTATVRSEGKVKFASKDVESTARVRNLDLVHFKPYYDKANQSIHVKKGLIDLDIHTKVVSHKINAPGKATLRGLELDAGSGMKSIFMGVPASLLMSTMKKNGDQLPVEFVVTGDLDNPKFNLAESFMTRIQYALAEKMGISIGDIGGSIIGLGAEGTKKVGESITEGFKKIFK